MKEPENHSSPQADIFPKDVLKILPSPIIAERVTARVIALLAINGGILLLRSRLYFLIPKGLEGIFVPLGLGIWVLSNCFIFNVFIFNIKHKYKELSKKYTIPLKATSVVNGVIYNSDGSFASILRISEGVLTSSDFKAVRLKSEILKWVTKNSLNFHLVIKEVPFPVDLLYEKLKKSKNQISRETLAYNIKNSDFSKKSFETVVMFVYQDRDTLKEFKRFLEKNVKGSSLFVELVITEEQLNSSFRDLFGFPVNFNFKENNNPEYKEALKEIEKVKINKGGIRYE